MMADAFETAAAPEELTDASPSEESHDERSLVDEVAAQSSGAEHRVELASGRKLEVREGADDQLTVIGSSGRVELSIRFTDEGPKLSFEAADIEFRASRDIKFDCDNLELNARSHARIIAADTHIEATGGNVDVHANDAVSLVGEQVRLNCDKPDDVPDWMKRRLSAELLSNVADRTLPPSKILGDETLLEQFRRQEE